jgi:hypothetical protein
MTLWRVEFFIGATVDTPGKKEAAPQAKRLLEQRYGAGVVQAIEEQANAIVVFAVPPKEAH